MFYNAQFTTYRLAVASNKYDYSVTATITAGWGFMEQLGSEFKAILGISNAVIAYSLLTEETNLQIADKVIINSVSYYLSELEDFDYNGIIYKKCVLTRDKDT